MTKSGPPIPFGDRDYDAIEAAVMESAKGRWFLTEYARKNRYADTEILLEAMRRLHNALVDPDQREKDGSPLIADADAITNTIEAAVIAQVEQAPAPSEQAPTSSQAPRAPEEDTSTKAPPSVNVSMDGKSEKEIQGVKDGLFAMADAIAETRRQIATMRPKVGDDSNIFIATEELSEIVSTTENATASILEAAEAIQEIAWSLREKIDDEESCDKLDALATDIFMACSFQDLTGQRTQKVVTLLKFIERRIESMTNILGLDGEGSNETIPPVETIDDMDTRPDSHLLNGPQSAEKAIAQDDIDSMMFGSDGADSDVDINEISFDSIDTNDSNSDSSAPMDNSNIDEISFDSIDTDDEPLDNASIDDISFDSISSDEEISEEALDSISFDPIEESDENLDDSAVAADSSESEVTEPDSSLEDSVVSTSDDDQTEDIQVKVEVANNEDATVEVASDISEPEELSSEENVLQGSNSDTIDIENLNAELDVSENEDEIKSAEPEIAEVEPTKDEADPMADSDIEFVETKPVTEQVENEIQTSDQISPSIEEEAQEDEAPMSRLAMAIQRNKEQQEQSDANQEQNSPGKIVVTQTSAAQKLESAEETQVSEPVAESKPETGSNTDDDSFNKEDIVAISDAIENAEPAKISALGSASSGSDALSNLSEVQQKVLFS